ncbi:MAG: ECF-type sigma factor, partial [bacterium]
MAAVLPDGTTPASLEWTPALFEEVRAVARRCMRGQPPDHTLQATALVSEAFLRLAAIQPQILDHHHLLALTAKVIRQVLVDHARRKHAAKRQGGRLRLTLDEQIASSVAEPEEVVHLDEALMRLEQLDSRQAQVVELRFFAGLSVEEVAKTLNVSKRTVEGDWTLARAWLKRELSG